MPPFKQGPQNNKPAEPSPDQLGRRDFIKKMVVTGAGIAATVTGFDSEAKGNRDRRTEFERYMDSLRMKIVRNDETISYLKGLSKEGMDVINTHFSSEFQRYRTNHIPEIMGVSTVAGAVAASGLLAANAAAEEGISTGDALLAGGLVGNLPGGLVGGGVGAVLISDSFKPDFIQSMSRDNQSYFVETFFDKGIILTQETVAHEIDRLINESKELLDKIKQTKEETFTK